MKRSATKKISYELLMRRYLSGMKNYFFVGWFSQAQLMNKASCCWLNASLILSHSDAFTVDSLPTRVLIQSGFFELGTWQNFPMRIFTTEILCNVSLLPQDFHSTENFMFKFTMLVVSNVEFLGVRSKNTVCIIASIGDVVHQQNKTWGLMLREILFSHVIPHRTRESTYLVNYLSLVRWRTQIAAKSLSA